MAKLETAFVTGIRFTAGRTTAVAVLLGLAAAHASASYAFAQPITPPPSSANAGKTNKPAKSLAPAVAVQTEAPPKWQELTPAQQQSLKPLAANWSTIGEAQKRKWIAVSKNYPSLSAPEQAKLHSRMTEWVSLSARQRAEARLNFAETKKLSPNEKAANWQAYQALSPEEKQKLAAKAVPKPTGAAAAVRPVAPQKLAVKPLPKQGAKHSGQVVSSTQAVDRNTLLPLAPATADPATVHKN